MADSGDNPAAEQVVRQLLRIHRYLRTYSKRISSELGVSGRQLAVLRYLHEAGPLSIGQISARLLVADSTTSELIDGLERCGLVARSRSPEDNRVAIVTLQSAGEELVARAPLGGVALLRRRLRSWPPDQVNALAQALVELGTLMEIDTLEPQ